MADNYLAYGVWLRLSMATRYKIADMFGFKPRVPRHVVDATVVSDGFSPDDFALITKEKMQETTKVKSDDFYVLFGELVKQIENPVESQNADVQQTQQTQTNAPAKVKGGRKSKGGK